MSKAKKKKTYAVVQSSDLEKLINQINILLESDHEVIGGISTVVSVRDQSQIIYTQALIHEH